MGRMKFPNSDGLATASVCSEMLYNESNALAIQGPQIEQMIGQIEQMIAVQVAVHAEY